MLCLELPDSDIKVKGHKKGGVVGVNSGQDHVIHDRLVLVRSFLSKFTGDEDGMCF